MKLADVKLVDTFGNPYTETVENVADVFFETDFVVLHQHGPDGAVSNLSAYHKDRVLDVKKYHDKREL